MINKLRAMEVFVHIVQAGSLTGAADALDTSSTSVVRTLAALEETLGVRLLNRSTRHIALTDEGREYLVRCRHILAAVEEAEALLSDRLLEPSGRIVLTAPVTFGRRYIGPLINDFLQHFPKTQVELLLLDRTVDLIEEGVDLALRIGHLADSSLIARSVGQMRLVVCASPAYIEANGVPTQPADLSKHVCIQSSALDSSPEWLFRQGPHKQKVPITSRLTTNQVDSAMDACIKGLGCCRFLHYQANSAVRTGQLQLLLEPFEPPPLPINLLYPHSRLISNRIRVLIDWLLPRLKERLAAT